MTVSNVLSIQSVQYRESLIKASRIKDFEGFGVRAQIALQLSALGIAEGWSSYILYFVGLEDFVRPHDGLMTARKTC